METSNKSTGDEWSDLPLYAVDTPVSLSPRQVLAKVRKMIATCGLGYDKPLASYDPTTQSLKMSEGIFPSGERPLLPILPPSGMTRNGALFQQPAWEPIIDEIESSSWPTPRANPGSMSAKTSDRHWSKSTHLAMQVAIAEGLINPQTGNLWPTPTAVTRPMEGNVRMYRAKVQKGEMTEAEAEAILGKSVWEAQGKLPAMWPTPTTQENEHPNAIYNNKGRRVSPGGSTHSRNLADTVKMLDQQQNGGKLNPRWVEWLMGFPDGWTDLEV